MHLSTHDFKMARASRLLPFAVLLIFALSLLWYTKSGHGLSSLKAHGNDDKINPAVGFKVHKDSANHVHNSTLGVGNSLQLRRHLC